MTEQEEGPEIVYVPGAENHYKYEHDVIVLDERLKDYPEAHEYIKNHELEHAKQGANAGFFELLRLELRTDIDHYFSESEEIAEVREYFDSISGEQRLHPAASLKFTLTNTLRELWNVPLRPLSWMYRKTNTVRERQ